MSTQVMSVAQWKMLNSLSLSLWVYMLLSKHMCVFWWQLQIPLITGRVLQSTIILVQIILALHFLSSTGGYVVGRAWALEPSGFSLASWFSFKFCSVTYSFSGASEITGSLRVCQRNADNQKDWVRETVPAGPTPMPPLFPYLAAGRDPVTLQHVASRTRNQQVVASLMCKGQKVRMPKDGLQDDCGKRAGKWQHAQVREGTLSLTEAYWKLHSCGWD